MARVVMNRAEIARLLTGRDGPVYRDMVRRCERVTNRAKTLCPVNQGRLRSSITYVISIEGGWVIGRIGTNVSYALAVHSGSGIFGPKGSPIVPTSATFLRFKPKGGAKFVFARSVKGMPGRPFLKNALPAGL